MLFSTIFTFSFNTSIYSFFNVTFIGCLRFPCLTHDSFLLPVKEQVTLHQSVCFRCFCPDCADSNCIAVKCVHGKTLLAGRPMVWVSSSAIYSDSLIVLTYKWPNKCIFFFVKCYHCPVAQWQNKETELLRKHCRNYLSLFAAFTHHIIHLNGQFSYLFE